MRKLCVMLLLLLMCCLPALAEEVDPLKADGEAKVLAGIAELAEAETGWKKAMMEHTTVVSSKRGKEYLTVTVAIPTLKCGVSTNEQAGDDVRDYLSRALAGAVDWTNTVEYSISITIKGKGDAAELSFDTTRTLGGYRKKVSSMVTTAAQSYAVTQVRSALYSYLMPRAATMPKTRPEVMPELDPLADYSSAVAGALGLTEEQASGRLPAMLLLLQLTKVDATAGLDAAELTVKVKDWQTMLADAYAAAQEVMPDMMGVPDMSREEIEAILVQQLPAACKEAYYSTKTPKTMTMTVDLTSAVDEGVGTAESLMALFLEYGAEVDAYVDALMEYGSTLSYYPEVAIIDTAILAGESAESGTRVFFAAEGENHGYVCILRDGEAVIKGFARSGARLMVVLEPGEYEVWCSYGPDWYGESYAFGKESYCGVFTLEVPESGNMRITLADGEGGLPVEQVTYEEFAAVMQQ
ncbi:MAG: hypothetical protein ACI4O7_01525 [Aristaeellaceae bacterium]